MSAKGHKRTSATYYSACCEVSPGTVGYLMLFDVDQPGE
jgi:hypothetical protein